MYNLVALPDGMRGERFNKKEHKGKLEKGMFIRFRYGVTENKKNHTSLIGKIKDWNWRGIDVWTSYGYHFASWKRIDRIYFPRAKKKKRNKKLSD